ncbi:DUF3575 domain-containing protein [Alloprevotella sp. oral taxon 473]|uniref:DUF3575 domain-containing protein n=1 Tax=Alloprevotella sp. oral taxon 473 TaxID=712469 RepID=UPI0002A3433E|nr:DUF3575 domain-containing protein [Alloprevotella sp. oral taxon 473]EKX92771.1 hypothetical protein HMPREF9999_00580 [Alloprevotella sp. oral taxon 473 str. F0040]
MKRFLLQLFLFAYALWAGASLSTTTRVSLLRGDTIVAQAYKWYPKYITFLPADKLDSVLAYAYTDIVPVIYEVNKTVLRENDQLIEIVNLINKIKDDSRVKVSYIWIGGSASPEGPISGNEHLGQLRTQVFADYIKAKTGLTDADIRTENLWEDWVMLSRVLEEQEFPNKEKVLTIISNEPDWTERKNKIKAIDGGRTWQLLLREVFPMLRNSRMVIVCSAEDIKVSPPLPPLPAPPVAEEPKDTVPVARIPEAPIEQPVENRFWSIKTNGLFLGALIANAGFEVELWRRWSLDVPFWYSPYNYTPARKLRLLATQPELRHWLRKAGQGHFFGLHTHIVGFNVAINDHGRYQDPNHALWGMGLSYGYATHLDKAKRWSLEFNIGAGFAEYDYDVYRNWHNGPKFRSGNDFYWGITRAGVSIAYKFYKPRKK